MILAIDQGTTGTRAVVYAKGGKVKASSYREFRQYYPAPGLVEHDAAEIWKVTQTVVKEAWAKAGRPALAAVGITNQRETTVVWDSVTGKPLAKAIVWQDRRTAEVCRKLEAAGNLPSVRHKTGLVLDPYFSATKLAWLLKRNPGWKKLGGRLKFGTIDSWIIWNLTGGAVHATDYTNASRTLVFDIRKLAWDAELLKLFGVPAACLPEARASAAGFGRTAQGALPAGIPIAAVMGDQQAALYGQGCVRAGQAKNTYGTGCFIVVAAGKKTPTPPKGILATVAVDENGGPAYALEGSVFVAGAAVQWLRDGLGIIKAAGETEALARSVKDCAGVSFVPALAGLGAPFWDAEARGVIAGLTRGATKAHLVRATLEGVAQRNADVTEAMERGLGRGLAELRADGGMTNNSFLMQTQADLLGAPVLVSSIAEATAWGAAKLAGRAAGFWKDPSPGGYKKYSPKMRSGDRARMRAAWERALAQARSKAR